MNVHRVDLALSESTINILGTAGLSSHVLFLPVTQPAGICLKIRPSITISLYIKFDLPCSTKRFYFN